MSIIDRSPGGFIILANTILYSTVLAETGMLMSGSVFLMGVFMALVIALSAGLCAFIMRLMGSEEYISGESESLELVKVPRVRSSSRPATVTVVAAS